MIILTMERFINRLEEKKYLFGKNHNIESYVCINEEYLDYNLLNVVEMNLEYNQELTDNYNRWKRPTEYEKLNVEFISFSLKFKDCNISDFSIRYDSNHDLIHIHTIKSLHFKHYPDYEKIKDLCDGIEEANISLILNIDDLLKNLTSITKNKTNNIKILDLMYKSNFLKNLATTYLMLLMRTNIILSKYDHDSKKLNKKDHTEKIFKSSIERMFNLYYETSDLVILGEKIREAREIAKSIDSDLYSIYSKFSNFFDWFSEFYRINDQFEKIAHSVKFNKYSIKKIEKIGIKATYKAKRETLSSIFDLKNNQKILNFTSESNAPIRRRDNYSMHLWSTLEYNVSNNVMICNLISSYKQTITSESEHELELDNEEVLASVRFYNYINELMEENLLMGILYDEMLHIP